MLTCKDHVKAVEMSYQPNILKGLSNGELTAFGIIDF